MKATSAGAFAQTAIVADDPFDLERFVEVQAPIYERVVDELRGGQKQSHWMWFVFPQIAGLGSSAMAVRYALSCVEEAREYLNHPVLGARLRECTQLVLAADSSDAHAIFGSPDDLKFRSSMSLFAKAAPDEPLFADALDKFFGGHELQN